MIIEPRIKKFERLGFGMFVHFGLYSILGKGEWVKSAHNIPDEEYFPLTERFNPEPDWAERLADCAKAAGCKYITLTTRHHDGFSLYDTMGLNTYDAPHSRCGRDLVREFVDACREKDIIPFFYHTYLDWYNKDYKEDWKKYLEYLRKSVEILCTRYGEIGGIWFDGTWDKHDADWEEDAMYGLIRRYQPNAIIINNTGLGDAGSLGHIELDSVTFERNAVHPILNSEEFPKYIASEMCQVMGDFWGYAEADLNYKSPATLIKDLCNCRRYGANFLLNVGPMPNGYIRPLDREILNVVGEWVNIYDKAIRTPRPAELEIKSVTPEDFVLKEDNKYYVFCHRIGLMGDPFVVKKTELNDIGLVLPEKIKRMTWLDDGSEVNYEQNGSEVCIHTDQFEYGRNLVVRVAEIEI